MIEHAGQDTTRRQSLRRIPVINGLRGIAILGVLMCHLFYRRLDPAASIVTVFGERISLSPLLSNGWTGVNLFFILSGFVLYLPYAAETRSMEPLSGRLAFYRHRFLRLMPLFYTAVITEWLLFAHYRTGSGLGELAAVLSVTFIFDPKTFGPSFNPALWSIGVEITFSIVFPVLVVLFRRFGIARLLPLILAVSLLARGIGIMASPAVAVTTFNSDSVVCHLDEFFLGMVLAQLYWRGRLPVRPKLYATIGAVLVLIAWEGFDRVLQTGLPPIARAVLNNVLDAGLVSILAAALVSRSTLAGFLSWRPLQVLGMMCYSVYIWHYPLLFWLSPGGRPLSAGQFAVLLPEALALIVVVSVLSYRFIEFRSVRDWRRLFLLAPPRAALRERPRLAD